jgi:hypothetical protein
VGCACIALGLPSAQTMPQYHQKEHYNFCIGVVLEKAETDAGLFPN